MVEVVGSARSQLLYRMLDEISFAPDNVFNEYLRRTSCNIFATTAYSGAQNGAVAGGADERSNCWERRGDGFR